LCYKWLCVYITLVVKYALGNLLIIWFFWTACHSMGSLLIVHKKSTSILRRSRAVKSASEVFLSVFIKDVRTDILLVIEAVNFKM
jgi:hypothetical protein